MRLPTTTRSCSSPSEISRRSAHSLAAWALTASAALWQAPVSALVDGIPLYAPGDQIKLPEVGFEVQLPRLEYMRDRLLPSIRTAVGESDFEGAAKQIGIEQVKQQLQVLGDTASILGDEAYTAVSLKSKYALTVKKLQVAVVSMKQDDALREVTNLDAVVGDYIGLIPPKVVELVRSRESTLARLTNAEAPAAPTAAPAAKPVDNDGLLMAPTNAGKKVCGVDIRC